MFAMKHPRAERDAKGAAVRASVPGAARGSAGPHDDQAFAMALADALRDILQDERARAA
jgi:hypothetical protein